MENILNNPQPVTTLQSFAECSALAFSPDSRFFASGGYGHQHNGSNKVIQLCEINNNHESGLEIQMLVTLKDHAGWITAIAFSPDNRFLASGSIDNTIKVWDLAQGIKLFATINNNSEVESFAFSPTDNILCCNQGNNIAVYTPYWTLSPDYIKCLIRWYRNKPTFDNLSDEDKAMFAEMPAGARPDWLTNSMNNQMP